MENQIISINLVPNLSTPAVVRVSQYDVGRPLVFKVYDGTSPADLTGLTAVIEGTKKSGLGFSESGTITDNTVSLDTTLAMTQEDGSIPAEIRFSKTGEDVGTANFILSVEKTPHAEGTTDGTQETMQNLEARINATIDSMTLGIDEDDGLLYLYVNGVKQGEGIDIGGGSTRYTITYHLATNMVSSNTATKVSEGGSYATTISSTHPDYQVNVITVTMGGSDVTATAVSGHEIAIPSVTGDVVITVTALFYPSVVTDANAMTISSGSTGTLQVKLNAQPTQSQTVSLYSSTLTLSSASLTFTTSNWNTYQSVTVTAPSVDATTYDYIGIVNSDPMMTESTVMVTVKELGYEDLVDTTIPTTGQHTLTAADFASSQDTTIDGVTYTRFYGYNGAYTNVIMPEEIGGKKTLTVGTATSPSSSNSTFYGNTTIEYVTFENGCRIGESGVADSNKASRLFGGCTSLVGVSNIPTTVVGLANAFNGCTSLEFVDNLDELVNVTTINNAFYGCTSLEYIQDLSNWTALTNVQAAFQGSGLKKIFGLPELNTTTANASNMYNSCSALKYGILPKGVNSTAYAFNNCSACERVDIFEDDLSTTGITNTTFSGVNNLEVYCNADTTTYSSLVTQYGSSTKVTIKTFGGGSTPSIVVWGDSISSPNKAWIEWPARLQTKLGTSTYLVKNEALAGEGSPSTTARQGGYAMTTNAFTIPATTTAAELTITVNGTETFTGGGTDVSPNAGIFSAGGSFNPCTISGVKGAISRSGSQYYFTRLEAGTAVNVSAGTAITSDKDTTFNASDNVMIFYLNGNAGFHNDADTLLDMFQKAVTHFTTLGGTKYIVAGPAANKLFKTTAFHDAVLEFEPKAATAFGSHWLNLREYEITYGLSQNNLTPSALDTERMTAGLVPASLVGGGSTSDIQMYNGTTNTDENHPNVYGANTIMLAFYEKGVSLGYWT